MLVKLRLDLLTALTAVALIVLSGTSSAEDVASPADKSESTKVTTDSTLDNAEAFHLIVMDPLAAPLSCPCVEGYAQRKYEFLGKYLESAAGKPVKVTFAESLARALKETDQHADLIIGKDSVVRADAAAAKIDVGLVAALTDKTGATMQHGLFLVRSDDPAQKVADLKGYEVYFGPQECDEKHRAAINLLKQEGIPIPVTLSIDAACSDGACKVVELGKDQKVATVISSYAAPLLEGCGTIKKGDLKVIGKTEPVDFIRAFVNESLPESTRSEVQKALLSVVLEPEVCEKLESQLGFVEPDSKKK